MVSVDEEVALDWSEESAQPSSHIRSTLISSSVQTLKDRGHYERYLALLPEEHHEAVLLTLAATWLDIEHGIAHYRACDALHLPRSELVAIGGGVGDRIQGTFLGQLAKGARGVGANPWIPLLRFGGLWGRVLQGGGVRVIKLGPKDARIDVRNSPLHEIEYFRVAFHGIVMAATDVFARKSYTKEVASAREAQFSYSLSWV